jgi:transposase
MAGKVTLMSKIKQLIQLHESGVSNRRIAKALSVDRETVNSYVRKMKAAGMKSVELMQLDDPVLEGKFMAGTAAYTDHRFEEFKELIPWLERELKRPHATRHLLWQEYLLTHPDGYRYTQFCHHLKQMLIARRPTAVLTHRAGEKLFVDFAGDRMEVIDIHTGAAKNVHIFIACLPYSGYTFTMAVEQQTTEDFLHALACCLEHLGGCPGIVVPDNLKAAVVKTDRYEPALNRLMEDFANHYGFGVMPARAYHPRDKAKVENHVRIIYSRVYAKLRNRRFFSLEELNRALAEKTMEHNQTRMQRADYSRREKFLADEKHLLASLPETGFEIKYYADLRVGQNNHVYLGRDKHYYSVPYIYTGKKVHVVYTRTMVRIFCNNERIATHLRVRGDGYSTLNEHLCAAHRHYNRRSPDYYIETARKRSAALAEIITLIFSRPKPAELFYRTCDALLSLCRKTDPVSFEKACRMALDNGVYNCRFIKSLIESNSLMEENQMYKPLPVPKDNLRGRQYFIYNSIIKK